MLIVSLVLFLVIIFVIMIFILRRIMISNLTSATSHLEELNREYAQKEKDATQKLKDAEQKSQEIIKTAKDEAEKLKAKIIQEAEEERDRLLKQGRTQSDEIIKQADKSRQLLLAEINERIAKDAVDKACELIQNTLPEQFKLNVHGHWVTELIEKGFSQLEHLRIPQDSNEVKVISAFPLEEEQRKAIFKKIKSVVASEAAIKEEVDPKVVAGIIIAIGSLVLDGSLKNKIKEKAKGF